METVVVHNLVVEPLLTTRDENGREHGRLVMEEGVPVVFASDETGPLLEVLDRVGSDCTALVAIPLKTHAKARGLLSFYLPLVAPLPSEDTLVHLSRLGRGLALAIDVASESPPKEQREDTESTGTTGRIAHRAILEIGSRIDRLLVAMGRIRGHGDAPKWLHGELLGIGVDLALTKQLRDSVSSFVTKRRHPLRRVGLDGLLKWLHAECAEALARQGIRLEVTREPGAPDVRADAFLLRCALLGLVRRSQDSLAPGSGGLIRVAATSGEASVHIIVAHQTRDRRDMGSARPRDESSELALVRARNGARARRHRSRTGKRVPGGLPTQPHPSPGSPGVLRRAGGGVAKAARCRPAPQSRRSPVHERNVVLSRRAPLRGAKDDHSSRAPEPPCQREASRHLVRRVLERARTYSIAMTLQQQPSLATWDVGIHATDYSQKILERARNGRYGQHEVNRGLPATLLVKYFEQEGAQWRVTDEIRQMIDFRQMNLVQPWARRPPMDVIFMRNVLIYLGLRGFVWVEDGISE